MLGLLLMLLGLLLPLLGLLVLVLGVQIIDFSKVLHDGHTIKAQSSHNLRTFFAQSSHILRTIFAQTVKNNITNDIQGFHDFSFGFVALSGFSLTFISAQTYKK